MCTTWCRVEGNPKVEATDRQVFALCIAHEGLSHLREDARALRHVVKFLAEVEGDAINDDKFDLHMTHVCLAPMAVGQTG